MGQRWIGDDYYPSCEHRISSHRRQRWPASRWASGRRHGILPAYQSRSSTARQQVPASALGWQGAWEDVLASAAPAPDERLHLYSLTDQITGRTRAREQP